MNNAASTVLKAVLAITVSATTCGCMSGGGAPLAAELTPMQRAAMQTKELSGDFDTAYKATISVLQDHGWQIDEADRDSGLIQASSTRRQDVIGPGDDYRSNDDLITKTRKKLAAFKGNKEVSAPLWNRWERVTVLVEPWGDKTVRERITIVRCGALPSGKHYYPIPKAFGYQDNEVYEDAREQSVIVDTPQTYQQLFQEIQKAVFIRQGLTRR